MRRIRQIRDVIMERHTEAARVDLRVREVELRTLCAFIAGTAANPKAVKALAQAASKVRLLRDSAAKRLPTVDQIVGMFSGVRD